MNDFTNEIQSVTSQQSVLPQYVTPAVRVMSDAEVLSAFQVNATSASMAWWVC